MRTWQTPNGCTMTCGTLEDFPQFWQFMKWRERRLRNLKEFLGRSPSPNTPLLRSRSRTPLRRMRTTRTRRGQEEEGAGASRGAVDQRDRQHLEEEREERDLSSYVERIRSHDREQLRCARENCWFLVNSCTDYGGYCCRHCEKRTRQKRVKHKHGYSCERKEAAPDAVRSAPVAPINPL